MIPPCRIALFLVAALGGCERGCNSQSVSSPNDAGTVSTVSTVSSSPSLDRPARLTVKGADVPIRSAIAYTHGGTALRVVVSDHARRCDEIESSELRVSNDEVLASVDVADVVERDAGTKFRVRETRLWNSYGGENGRAELVAGDAAPGHDVRIRVAVDLIGYPERPDQFEGRLEGEVTAFGCGDHPRSRTPLRPQSELVLEISGRKYEVMGAKLSDHVGKPYLSLTTTRIGCDDHGEYGDAYVGIKLSPSYDSVDEVYLGGDRYRNGRIKPASDDFNAKLEPSNEREASIALDGTVDIGGYSVMLRGRVRALRCN